MRPLVLLVAADDRAGMIDALRACREQPVDRLETGPAAAPRGRERLAIVTTPAAAHAAIDLALQRLPSFGGRRWVARQEGISFAADATPGRIAFLFPGQGSQHPGMLGDLPARMPVVGRWFDALDAASLEAGRPRPSLLLVESGSPDERHARHVALHDMEQGAQLGAVAELALFDVVSALGVAADVHIGHSNGEHAAVIAAGRVQADVDALCRSFVRLGQAGARLPRPTVPEGLLAVSVVRRERLDERLRDSGGRLALAMDNCPTQVVVGGAQSDLSALADALSSSGGVAVPLPFARAYHTPRFADWQATLAAYYRELPIGPGRVPVYSCLTTGPLPDDAEACRALMAAQWTACVRFGATIERAYADGVRTFVEIGPGATLTAFVEDVLRGRPHRAASTSSPARGAIEQLGHLAADLFLAGLAIDPANLWRLLDESPPAPPAVATGSPWDEAAAVHRRLIADATARLVRTSSAVSTARWRAPLLEAIRLDGASGLEAHRRFTRAADPFVDDHALGRRGAAHPAGGYPLPVLPFTLSVAIAAEAARALTGAPVREVRDVRASQWLALDRGELVVDIQAAAAPAGVHVRLTSRDRRAPGAAFEATVVTGASDAEPPRLARPDLDPPRQWSARSFYERYAFHGPSFQGIEAVRGVGPEGIEADIRVTAIPGLAHDGLVVDPAMLDCAGQLVAFWLLEHDQRPPAFGIFPFAARRIVVGSPPPAPGARLTARCEVVRDESQTDATCVFESAEGGVVLAIEGLRQRLVPFPGALARTIFGGEAADGRALRAIDPEIFETSWGIWGRALAHLALAPDDLERWHAMRSGDGVRWLLDRL